MRDRRTDRLDAPAITRRPGWSPPRPASSQRARPSPFEQAGFQVRVDWGLAGVRILAPVVDLVVVVDVLSFSSAVSMAVEQGARIVPQPMDGPTADGTAAAHARASGATLASPRRGAPGPTLSLASLAGLRPGELLVLPSPNGSTCAVEAVAAGTMVVAGCLRNASAVGRLIEAHGGNAAIIAAGEQWPDGSLRPCLEDLLGAGAILAGLEPPNLSPEARAAVGAFRSARSRVGRALTDSASGRELLERGFGADVALASELDATDRVPVLIDGAFTAGMG
jgi:2-phosphosulfolactate phosphatase